MGSIGLAVFFSKGYMEGERFSIVAGVDSKLTTETIEDLCGSLFSVLDDHRAMGAEKFGAVVLVGADDQGFEDAATVLKEVARSGYEAVNGEDPDQSTQMSFDAFALWFIQGLHRERASSEERPFRGN